MVFVSQLNLSPQMHLGGAGADVVSDGQRAAPVLGRHRTFERRQQRLRVAIGNGQHGNLGQRLGFAEGRRFASLVAPTPGVSGSPG